MLRLLTAAAFKPLLDHAHVILWTGRDAATDAAVPGQHEHGHGAEVRPGGQRACSAGNSTCVSTVPSHSYASPNTRPSAWKPWLRQMLVLNGLAGATFPVNNRDPWLSLLLQDP